MQELQKIAVVIDADNTQISKLEDVFHEISTRGRIVVKRAYGNWHKPTLKNWGEIIKRLAIKAEQQFDYVSGKNATDMALVIDTIELLYTNLYDAFVIVSSDSDYTPLAIKLREAGVYVMGVGEQKTPVAFRNQEHFTTKEKKSNLVHNGIVFFAHLNNYAKFFCTYRLFIPQMQVSKFTTNAYILWEVGQHRHSRHLF